MKELRFRYEDTIYKNGKNIPKTSGLYTWYLDFSKLGIVNNKDDFSTIVYRLNELITSEIMKGEVSSPLKKYSVNVHQNTNFFNDYLIDSDLTEGKKISELSDEDCVKIFKILGEFSHLVSPLYIGVASSLRSRYRSHKRNFYEIVTLIDEGADKVIIQEKAKKTFGGRLAYQGFNWDLLIFNCVKTDLESPLNKSTEYLLNRMYSPIFGKR
ncbi:hypothetical protein [Psychroflexus montanilacus]|uniref:hypothetical protein n=1 Tax=Psychroflexus montanilacus TaxID=2873598 RepID=UPI001CCA9FFB|nr:hypothetical protein [Psychroflexus montanilacus]MBZ9650995.1 hypothetical protein [Psychroflexus montanilacus]